MHLRIELARRLTRNTGVAIEAPHGSAPKPFIAGLDPHEPFQHRNISVVEAIMPELAFGRHHGTATAKVMKIARPALACRFELSLLAVKVRKGGLVWLLQEIVQPFALCVYQYNAGNV